MIKQISQWKFYFFPIQPKWPFQNDRSHQFYYIVSDWFALFTHFGKLSGLMKLDSQTIRNFVGMSIKEFLTFFSPHRQNVFLHGHTKRKTEKKKIQVLISIDILCSCSPVPNTLLMRLPCLFPLFLNWNTLSFCWDSLVCPQYEVDGISLIWFPKWLLH